MAFKTLTIKASVYKELAHVKQQGESFSDLLHRLAGGKQSSPPSLAGSLDLSDEDVKKRLSFYRSWGREWDKSFRKQRP